MHRGHIELGSSSSGVQQYRRDQKKGKVQDIDKSLAERQPQLDKGKSEKKKKKVDGL